jgi:hypothetical protein
VAREPGVTAADLSGWRGAMRDAAADRLVRLKQLKPALRNSANGRKHARAIPVPSDTYIAGETACLLRSAPVATERMTHDDSDPAKTRQAAS